jgi:hypothetical protein
MSQLSPSEITKVRKAALHSVTLSSDMKSTVVDAKLKELIQDIKKVLIKKDAVVEVVGLKNNA